jgi:hypothetical protein
MHFAKHASRIAYSASGPPLSALANRLRDHSLLRRFYLQTARLFVLSFLMIFQVAASCAQNKVTSEILREVHSEGRVDPLPDPRSVYIAAVPMSLPNTPAPQSENVKVRVIDKKFIFTMAALGGAESLRFTTHKLVLDHEFAAGAPWVTRVPSTQHLVVKYAAIYAAELLVAYELKKPHSWLPGDKVIKKLWLIYPTTMIPIDIKNGIRSIRTQPPSCPVDQCQAP